MVPCNLELREKRQLESVCGVFVEFLYGLREPCSAYSDASEWGQSFLFGSFPNFKFMFWRGMRFFFFETG